MVECTILIVEYRKAILLSIVNLFCAHIPVLINTFVACIVYKVKENILILFTFTFQIVLNVGRYLTNYNTYSYIIKLLFSSSLFIRDFVRVKSSSFFVSRQAIRFQVILTNYLFCNFSNNFKF